MKVALDVSGMHPLSRNRGIGVYANNLYHSLKENTNTDVKIIDSPSNEKFDLIHYPYFDFFQNSLKPKKTPTVITIHDIIPILFPMHYPPGLRGEFNWFLQKNALKKIDTIITVSKIVKSDLIKHLSIPPEKINVIYSAPSQSFTKIKDKKTLRNTKDKYRLPEEFVLYVGNINWNKNIINMTEAVLLSGKKLVIIGSSFTHKNNLTHPEKKDFKTWLEKYEKSENIKILNHVEELELVKIMNLATCLVFVSRYEGFGLPILEAQSCGLPVVTSNLSATKEITGSSALLVDPENIQGISEAIMRIFGNEKLKKELITKGLANAKKYTWEKTAKQTLKVYEKTLEQIN